MNRLLRPLWLAVAVLGLVAGCAMPSAPDTAPLLKLSPASLGRELAMAQQMQVEAGGRSVTMDVALEADATAVRMAVLQLGRTLARMEWDGQQLTRTLAPGWPDSLLAESVLNDLQLVWWPVGAIRGALPAGWTLEQTASRRTLWHGPQRVVVIELAQGGTTIVIRHPLEGYTVQVRTETQSPIFDATADKP
ncbi:DUF3261 domain-containing protein [Rhodoferax saidenbachensis]|uniref:DUF3261 domain-containing protein n=1 Tax=Rhodoferax saidenbachensis TaxID=1484693 RepID=A0A1P8KAR2_9BURK|nr:DUF3261 domain-containing protein [Rhodoferax saidenbachensis]APW43099.1 hypothetical protein RS694_11555 [Rhodoferax saidenbachensis]